MVTSKMFPWPVGELKAGDRHQKCIEICVLKNLDYYLHIILSAQSSVLRRRLGCLSGLATLLLIIKAGHVHHHFL